MTKSVVVPSITEQSSPPLNGHYPQQEADARPDAPDDGRYVTLEEYWANYYTHEDASYEWNDGYLEAKPMSTLVQYRLFLWFLKLLHEYVTFYDNAELMSLETGFTMNVPNPKKLGQMKKTVRKPDLAVILRTNAVQWGEHDHSYKGICDLCVESLSDSRPSEILRDTNIKKSEYAFAGVQEYYILDPENQYMVFYERTGNGIYVELQADADGVLRSKVLPGFQFRLSDLQRLPSFEALLTDDIYYYVLPGYRAALQRVVDEQQQAEQERQRAEQEQQRAEKERQRADRYAAQLRALGIKVAD